MDGGLFGCTAFHADAEYCAGTDNGTKPDVATRPEIRGGRDSELWDIEGWNTGGGKSNDEVRGGATYAAGIGGGVNREVKIPNPYDRTGEGA